MKKRTRKIELSPVKLRAVWVIQPTTRVKPSAKVYTRKGAKPDPQD